MIATYGRGGDHILPTALFVVIHVPELLGWAV